ncbi:MAG: hypothetical protein ACOYIP_06305 [Coriobacteriales bacterium]|jgi:hypothetical protein
MKFTIALAQTLHPENGDAVALVSRFARGAGAPPARTSSYSPNPS